MCGAAHLSDCVEVRGQFLGISSLLPGIKLRFTLFGDRSPHPLSHPGWAALNQVSIFQANKFLGVYSQRKRTRRFCQWEQTIRKKRPGVEARLHDSHGKEHYRIAQDSSPDAQGCTSEAVLCESRHPDGHWAHSATLGFKDRLPSNLQCSGLCIPRAVPRGSATTQPTRNTPFTVSPLG